MSCWSLRRGLCVVGLLAIVAVGVQWKFRAIKALLPAAGFESTKKLKISVSDPASLSPSKQHQSTSGSTSNFTSFDWRDPDRLRFYKPDLLCTGCYQHALEINAASSDAIIKTTCGELIQNETFAILDGFNKDGIITVPKGEHNYAIIQAAAAVSQKYPEDCHRCDTKSCPANEKIYLRFDDAGPTVLRSWIRPISKLLPQHRIFPKEGVRDVEAFFANRSHWYSQPGKRWWYWEYNPSIVATKGHEDLIPNGILNNKKESLTYLSTHRMSIVPTTFAQSRVYFGDFPGGGAWMLLEHINFSFLSQDMEVLLEGIFDVGYADYRIFILNNQLYLGMEERLYPMWIMPANHHNSQKKEFTVTHDHNVKIHRDFYQPETSPFELHVAQKHLCCANGCQGKNFNYFTTGDGQIWVQTNPAGPLVVQQVVPCDKASETGLQYYRHEFIPTMSFGTIDEPKLAGQGAFHNHKVSEHRGTTCCVRMHHNGLDLLVGISHRRHYGWDLWAAKETQYSSNLYAMLAEPPFTLVAMSGAFCLGHPNPEDEAINHWVPLTRLHSFEFGGIVFEKCPIIAFIQGMVENPNNPDTIIIGYGINDLINRFVEVSKANILQMLFDPYGTRVSSQL